ncbi:protein kinase family protein with leucine-rich repeat domain-containing protein [Artemisia annua]|uniref:Protein kinase family protein with leucine-rich repeat domain-containing protein n=1 Tax=Artemisia annua TaxID=35608 RepID=A0A2U1PET7_ARTAN|nr:protein kinase family protein with leucine-rich repeat domain-containing protein [Artemisia annua]
MNFYTTTIFFLATSTFLCTLYVPSCSTNDEVDALLKWKATLHSHNNNTLLPSWIHDQNVVSPCKWYGVSCNENGSVNRLNLSSSGLNGTLDSLSFSSFPNLVYFELSFNYFYGIIPSEIGRLSKLTDLILSKNQLSGSIPAEIVCSITKTLMLMGCVGFQTFYPVASHLMGRLVQKLKVRYIEWDKKKYAY